VEFSIKTEEYDFSPPTVTLSVNDVVDVELKETNVDWRGEEGKQYRKETNTRNGINRAKKQQQLTVAPETQGNLRLQTDRGYAQYVGNVVVK